MAYVQYIILHFWNVFYLTKIAVRTFGQCIWKRGYFFSLIHTLFNTLIVNRLAMYIVALCTVANFYFISWLSQVCGVYMFYIIFFFIVRNTGILFLFSTKHGCRLFLFATGMSCCLFSNATRHKLSSLSLLSHGKLSCPLFLLATRQKLWFFSLLWKSFVFNILLRATSLVFPFVTRQVL